MTQRFNIHTKWVWPVLAVLAVLAALLLFATPPEKTIGGVIRLILVHGALVQTGLVAFAAAGVAAIIYLLRPNPTVASWMYALQFTAVTVWMVYCLASMLATYLTWGQWIAWEEPRVRASFHVLWFTLACLVLVLWMRHARFAAVVNLIVAGGVLLIVKSASIIRHPLNPVGDSPSNSYQLTYLTLVLICIAGAALLASWIAGRKPLASEFAPSAIENQQSP